MRAVLGEFERSVPVAARLGFQPSCPMEVRVTGEPTGRQFYPLYDPYRVASVRVGARRITGRLLHARAGCFRSRGAAPHNAERPCSLCSNPAGQGPLPNAAGGARLVHLGGRLSTALEPSDIVGKERTMLTWPLVGSPRQDRGLALREGEPVGFQWLWWAYRRLSVRRNKRDGSIPITTQRGKGGDICGMVGGPGRVVPRDSRSHGNPGLFRRVVPAFFASHDLPGVVQDGLYVPVDHLPVLLYPGDRHLRRVVFPAAPVLPVYAAVQGWSEIKAGSASSVSSIRMLIGWIWE